MTLQNIVRRPKKHIPTVYPHAGIVRKNLTVSDQPNLHFFSFDTNLVKLTNNNDNQTVFLAWGGDNYRRRVV
jgi:hypothetical protein